MKIFICASKHNYHHIADIQEQLEGEGHIITLPNSYDNPGKEQATKDLGSEEHSKWKGEMIRLQKEKVSSNDAILVLNFDKGDHKNYIGGATFLEVYQAFDLGKKIFFYNPIADCKLRDEILGMSPVVVNGDLSLIV